MDGRHGKASRLAGDGKRARVRPLACFPLHNDEEEDRSPPLSWALGEIPLDFVTPLVMAAASHAICSRLTLLVWF
jgi:hypothetical protein